MMQAISIVFSLVQMAIIAESYQRFESQRLVGRNYPWYSAEKCRQRRQEMMLGLETTPTAAVPATRRYRDTAEITISADPEGSLESNESYGRNLLGAPVGTPERVNTRISEDENNLDLETKLFRQKSPLNSMMFQTSDIYNIEINGDTKPITGKESAIPPDDDMRILAKSEHGPEPISINTDKDKAPKRNQLSAEGEKPQSHGQRRASYLDDHDKGGMEDNEEGGWDDYFFDTSPTAPPPRPPPPVLGPFNKILNYPFNRLSTITDMFLLDTELYVKEHVPRLPEKIAKYEFKSHHSQTEEAAATTTAFRRTDTEGNPGRSILIAGHDQATVTDSMAINGAHWTKQDSAEGTTAAAAAPCLGGDDVVDGNVLMMPRRRRMVVGLEQEDFFAKTVGFLGWYFFILMRVASISVFACLHWREAIYFCTGHYVLMLGCLMYEVKLRAPMKRLLFYFFLSYIYIFVILEFKIKFIHLRMWYGLFVGFVFTQNFLLSVWWYVAVMDFELWWFDYLFRTILGSGVLSLCCLVVYYLRLKPKDKVLFEPM